MEKVATEFSCLALIDARLGFCLLSFKQFVQERWCSANFMLQIQSFVLASCNFKRQDIIMQVVYKMYWLLRMQNVYQHVKTYVWAQSMQCVNETVQVRTYNSHAEWHSNNRLIGKNDHLICIYTAKSNNSTCLSWQWPFPKQQPQTNKQLTIKYVIKNNDHCYICRVGAQNEWYTVVKL